MNFPSMKGSSTSTPSDPSPPSVGSSVDTASQLGRTIVGAFEKAINCDSWGQRLEAATEYWRVYNTYEESRVSLCTSEAVETQMKEIMKRIKHRAEELEGISPEESSVPQLREDLATVKGQIVTYQQRLVKRHSSIIELTANSMMLPPPKHDGHPGQYLTIKIEKMGVKDAKCYIDPYICIKFKDVLGNDVCEEQNTATCGRLAEKYLHFDVNLHMQKTMQQMPLDFAIFFELMHYKSKKDKVSCRCFAIVEREEIKPGQSAVEIYKKPVDYTRKRLMLFTEKPLFLHLVYKLSNAKDQ